MLVDAEVGDKPVMEDELAELELQARLGRPDPILVLRLLKNGEKEETEYEPMFYDWEHYERYEKG